MLIHCDRRATTKTGSARRLVPIRVLHATRVRWSLRVSSALACASDASHASHWMTVYDRAGTSKRVRPLVVAGLSNA